MRSGLFVLFFFAAGAAGAVACGSLLSTGDDDPEPARADAGAQGEAGSIPDAATPADAQVDALAEACAPNPIIDALTSPRAPFVTTGVAAYVPDAGILLTPDQANQYGGLWWNEVRTFDELALSFEFRITNGGSSKAGLGFAWTQAKSIPPMPPNGGTQWGVCGVPGYAAVVDTVDDLLLIVDTATCLGMANIPLPSGKEDGNWHKLSVTLSTGQVIVTLDGSSTVKKTISGYVPFTGLWGFGATTDDTSQGHWIRNVNLFFGTQPLCP